MTLLTLTEVERDTAAFLNRVRRGEKITVIRDDDFTNPAHTQPPRPVGLAKGEFQAPADFDAPLPDNVLDAFEGR